MGIPHILAIPYPVQGHVNPLMQFCHVLSKHGCKITFLNTEFNHKRTTSANNGCANNESQHNNNNHLNNNNNNINFVLLPDGLGDDDDRSDRQKQLLSIKRTMPPLLPKLIEDVNALDSENKITCIVMTGNMGWALEVGHKLGIQKCAFLWTASATSLACCDSIPKLIHDGIIDSSDGHATKRQEIQLSPNLPKLDTEDLPWVTIGNIFFTQLIQSMKTMELAEWWLCNTAYDLEPGAFSMSPRFLPIGPLMQNDFNNNNNNNKSSFWQEDITCLGWLDQQQPRSVVYVAFGSMVDLEPNQLKELAIGLDLLNGPFLWAVRPTNNNGKIEHEFRGSKGKIVGWVPQKKVLKHPSISCFISHCGWNSTMESVCSGVPFLCWPIFADQFVNKAYICGVWKVGMGFDKGEDGLVSRWEIRKKVEQVVGDEGIRVRSLKLKDLVLNNMVEGGQSPKNIHKFINWAK